MRIINANPNIKWSPWLDSVTLGSSSDLVESQENCLPPFIQVDDRISASRNTNALQFPWKLIYSKTLIYSPASAKRETAIRWRQSHNPHGNPSFAKRCSSEHTHLNVTSSFLWTASRSKRSSKRSRPRCRLNGVVWGRAVVTLKCVLATEHRVQQKQCAEAHKKWKDTSTLGAVYL